MTGSGGVRPLVAEADRERLIALLREHYAAGQLSLEDLDHRVGVVLGAEYLDEAAAAVTDLPAAAVTDRPPAAVTDRPAATGTAPAGSRRRVRRGHAHADQPAAGWIPTDERFRDPASQTVMRVWIDPADQSRHYIPEPAP